MGEKKGKVNMDLGKILKEERIKRGLSQQKLADEAAYVKGQCL